MTIGTEELIVQAVERLLMQKKVKKLTVKDIVEECGITRQTFYYHFRDIPDLLKWVLERIANLQNIRRALRPQARFGGPLDGQCPSVCKANPLVQLQNPLGFALLTITFS